MGPEKHKPHIVADRFHYYRCVNTVIECFVEEIVKNISSGI